MKQLRINHRIKSKEVMLIGEDKSKLGVIALQDALMQAKEVELDLVEVAPNETPPVCKIMDYGKFKYKQRKKEHESKKKQKVIHLKEIKLRPKIDEHDYKFKVNHVKRFILGGDKAKVTMHFRGREARHKDIGEKLLRRIIEELKETTIVEQHPKSVGKTLSMILGPKP